MFNNIICRIVLVAYLFAETIHGEIDHGFRSQWETIDCQQFSLLCHLKYKGHLSFLFSRTCILLCKKLRCHHRAKTLKFLHTSHLKLVHPCRVHNVGKNTKNTTNTAANTRYILKSPNPCTLASPYWKRTCYGVWSFSQDLGEKTSKKGLKNSAT